MIQNLFFAFLMMVSSDNLILVILSSLMLLKYLGNEIDEDDSFKLFGGAFLIVALFSRHLFRLGKRRYV